MLHLKLPNVIDSPMLAEHAAPDEQFAVVVEMTETSNLRQFQLSGRTTKHYVLRYCYERGKHVMLFPVSVWMADNAWFARDITARNRDLIILVEPWKGAVITERRVEQPESSAPEPSFEMTDEEINQKAAAALAL